MKLFSTLSPLSLCLVLSLMLAVSAEQCGIQGGNAKCPDNLCCSEWGFCGSTVDYCGKGCQTGYGRCDATPTPTPPPPSPHPPTPTPGGGGVASLISEETFNLMLLHRNDGACPAKNFYTYDAFIAAANQFSEFGTIGDDTTRKREIAAFLAQTSHETTGGWPTAPDGPYAWGYCFKEEINPVPGAYCVFSQQWPCVPGKEYFGRGPIQISYNYNYGPAGSALGLDLLANPDLVAADTYISFMTAFWFWMTPQSPKPSCHDVMIGNWQPSAADEAAGRLPGYGVVTNIINGGLECGRGYDDRVENRIGFYKRYCDILGVGYGDNLDCYNQRHFGSGVSLVDSI